ncbi:MAG: hypothetical protein KBA71_07875 [Opitutaceae bacterium]|nr:hypothetical protein [Opitutaceae bacterium]
MSANRGRAWVVAVAIFVVGVAVGGLATTWLGLQRIRHNLRSPGVSSGLFDRAGNRIGDDLVSALQLTPAEETGVRNEIEKMLVQLKQLRHRGALDAAAEVRATVRRIHMTLPPAKREKLREVLRHRFEKLGLTPPDLNEK